MIALSLSWILDPNTQILDSRALSLGLDPKFNPYNPFDWRLLSARVRSNPSPARPTDTDPGQGEGSAVTQSWLLGFCSKYCFGWKRGGLMGHFRRLKTINGEIGSRYWELEGHLDTTGRVIMEFLVIALDSFLSFCLGQSPLFLTVIKQEKSFQSWVVNKTRLNLDSQLDHRNGS